MGPFCNPICRDTRPCGRPYCTYNIEGERGEGGFFRRFRNNTQREEEGGDIFARYFQNNFVGYQGEQGEGRGFFRTYFQRNRRGGRGGHHQPPYFVNNIGGGGGRHEMYFNSNVGGEGRGHHQPYFVNNIIEGAEGGGDGASGGGGVPIYQTTVGPGDVLFLRTN